MYFSFGSGHHDNCSYEIPHECLSVWGSFTGEIISINKRNQQFNLRFLFKWLFPLTHMLQHFQDSFIIGETTSSHFFIVTTLKQQYLFGAATSSELLIFFRSFRFQISRHFAALIFSEQLLFQDKTSTGQPLLENRWIFRVDIFQNTDLFGGETVQNEDIFRKVTFLKQVLLRSINFSEELLFGKSKFIGKAIYRIAYFSWIATFQEWLLFQKALLSIRDTISQLHVLSTAALPINQLVAFSVQH